MVNFDKCWPGKVANVIREVQQYQQVRYGTGPLRYGTGQQYRQVRYGTGPLRYYCTGQQYRQVRYRTIEARQDVQARHPLRVVPPPLASRQQSSLPAAAAAAAAACW